MNLASAMRTIELTEYQPSGHLPLTVAERDALRAAIPSLSIAPAPGSRDDYILTPSSTIGALEIDDLSIRIQPKLPIGRVLYLASQALNAVDFRAEPFAFADAPTPLDVVVPAFISAAQRAFSRGLLHGYRSREETLNTVRGRINFAEQVRRRYDIPLPVEVRYDDFTEDILANRLVRAAARRLGSLRINDPRWRHSLGRIEATLGNVERVEFPSSDVPAVGFDRLNLHYREVVELSRLILRHTGLDQSRGEVRASGFLMDMNTIFQEFLVRALRRALRLSERSFRGDDGGLAIHLDLAETVTLKPDFTWWEGGACVFAGDAKYKSAAREPVRNADLYQALAYATALDLPAALLVYAEGREAAYEVQHAAKRLEVVSVNLAGSIENLEASVARVAWRIRSHRSESIHQRMISA